MSWEEARAAYQRLGRQNRQADEDLLARRILKGLGFGNTPDVIGRVERGLLGERFDDNPLFDRAVALFNCSLQNHSSKPFLGKRWAIQAVTVPTQAALIDKVYDQILVCRAFKAGEWPLVFGRVGQSKIGQAFTPWYVGELQELQPPFNVMPLEDRPDYRLVYQEAIQFVAQFGPYDYPVIPQVTEES